MDNNTCLPAQSHLDIDLLRSAIGPGLQIGVSEAVFLLISEPAVCKN